MRTIMLLAVLGIAVLLAGCVPSLHPLYTKQDLVVDNKLVGTWSDEDLEETWVFKAASDKAYDLTLTSNGEPAEFETHLVRLGGATFLDMYPKETKGVKNEYYLLHLIPAHTFSRIKIDGDVLSVAMLDGTWLEDVIDEGIVKIAHEDVEEDIVLTASTPELQKFLRKHAQDDQAFEAPTELRRKK